MSTHIPNLILTKILSVLLLISPAIVATTAGASETHMIWLMAGVGIYGLIVLVVLDMRIGQRNTAHEGRVATMVQRAIEQTDAVHGPMLEQARRIRAIDEEQDILSERIDTLETKSANHEGRLLALEQRRV